MQTFGSWLLKTKQFAPRYPGNCEGWVKHHQQQPGRAPRLVAADAGFYSRANEEAVEQIGVEYVSIPN